ncbi:FecR family protein [Paenibacillus germinis]|uniref:FecR family protein n=1 Tax=Paenibacillus germinis TaxID=2654979 RepID=UPI0014921D21|nr:FecR family protein [Paenibacillus germinis]
MGITKKSFVSLFLSSCLVFSLVSALLVKPVDAKTVRVAVIAALSGDVTIKKGGGSKSYDAYESMSLNQGDTVYTGASSSVTLNLSNGDADVTLGENAEINVSDLNTSDGNKKSKLKVWAGSMWVKVKSLAGSDDEFEIETPTAVMGVRGTQFFVTVDPKTGAIKMAVGAGKVSASTVKNGADSTQKSTITYLYPTQQISLDSRDETDDLSLKVDFLDLDDFIKDASPEIIKEIILNKAEIDKENEEFFAKKKKEIEEGKLVDDKTSLYVKDQAELDKVKQNLDNLIGNIAKKALTENKVDKESLNKLIEQANAKIDKQEKKLNLNNVKELDKTAGVDAEKEKIKKEMLQKLEAEKLKKQLEGAKKQEELKNKLAAALKALEDQKKKILEATKVAEEKAKAEAEARLKEQNGTNTSVPGSGGNSGNSGDTDPVPVPVPALTVASTVIAEAAANDGSITATQEITLANGTFAADMSTGVSVNNLPIGLSTYVTRVNDRQIKIAFSGKASSHAAANDVLDATVTIAKAKIVGATGDVTSNAFKFQFSDAVPAVSLDATTPGTDGKFNLDINLRDFVDLNEIYGVEVHLTYDSNIGFNSGEWASNSGIFGSNSADHVKEYSNGMKKELVFAVTNFGEGSSNIKVDGIGKLVTIPFIGFTNLEILTTTPNTIFVEKIVIVNKSNAGVRSIEVPELPKKTVNLPPINTD